MMTQSHGYIFHATGLLCGEFTGEFPAQRPGTRSFDVFFDLRRNKQLSKQSRGWWFDTPSLSLWRQCNSLCDPRNSRINKDAQRTSYAENVSIWWRHHAIVKGSMTVGLRTHINQHIKYPFVQCEAYRYVLRQILCFDINKHGMFLITAVHDCGVTAKENIISLIEISVTNAIYANNATKWKLIQAVWW